MQVRHFKGSHPEMVSDGRYAWSGQLPPYDIEPRTIFDVGGFIGDTAFLFATLHPTVRVIVFEPNPVNCRYLLWNIRINNLTERVWPLCAGLGSRSSVMRMSCSTTEYKGWGGILNVGCEISDPEATGKMSDDGFDVSVLGANDVLKHFRISYVDICRYLQK